MIKKTIEEKDLRDFLRSDPAQLDPVPSPPAFIANDLVVSRRRLFGAYLIGSILGYVLSLVVCAQYGVGLSSLSWKMAQVLHAIPDPWCPVFCGIIFGISPSLVSVLYLTRFQHRFLIFQMGWLPALVPVLGTFSLLAIGDERSWEWRAIWMVTAILTPYLIEGISALVLRQRQSPG